MIAGDQPIVPDAVLGVVAAGSGSDFVRSFGLPGDAVQAAHHLPGDSVRDIDVGKVTCTAAAAEVTRYFANIAQAGIGGAVVARSATLPGFLGPAEYVSAFWLVLPGFRPRTVRVDADGEAFWWRTAGSTAAACTSRRSPSRTTARLTFWSWPGRSRMRSPSCRRCTAGPTF